MSLGMSPLRRLESRLLRAQRDQLADAVAKLAAENDELRERLARAEDNAEFWHEQVFSLNEQLGQDEDDDRSIGLTRCGALLVVGPKFHGPSV